MSTVSASAQAEGVDVGQVTTRIEIQNLIDLARMRAGEIPASQVRRVVIEDILADTGATHLCLPQEMIDQLGLFLMEEIVVSTANGVAASRLYSGTTITVEGRTRGVDCVALPGPARPLLGAIPMEELGVEPDLKNRRLRLLPDEGPDTYLTIL